MDLTAPHLHAVALGILHSEHDAQDALQEAYISAFKSLDQFDGRARLSTWLHRIVVNTSLMKLRAKRRRPERRIEELLPTFQSDGHPTTFASAWKPGALVGIEGDELRTLVRDKIAELPETYQMVLILRDVEGCSTAVAADILGTSETVVKVRLHRARQALRALLDPYFSGRPSPSTPEHS